MLKRSIVFATRTWDVLPGLAQAAESAGFSRVWTTESIGRDALIRAGALLGATSRLEVGSGIAYAFSRSPLATGGAARDLNVCYGGRFTLGLGAGTRGVRRRFGMSVDKPAPWFEEYVDIVRRSVNPADGFAAHGDYFDVDVPAGTSFDTQVDVPVYGAAINPIMITRAAACCDGVALLSLGLGDAYFDQVVLPAFRKGRERAGKPATGGLACWCITAIDEDEEKALHQAKRQLAFYFSTPSYSRPAEALGFGDEVSEIQATFRATHDFAKTTAVVTDEMARRFCVVGTPDSARDQLAALEARLEPTGADEIALQLPTGDLSGPEVARLCTAVIENFGPASAVSG